MQRIGDSTSTANGSKEFTQGQPASGVDATLLTPAWLNAIQRELVNLIVGAGMDIVPSDDSQVLNAVKALQAAAGTWAKLANKPTTVAGFGITDAFTKTETSSAIQKAVSDLVASSPAALDTLNELAAALGNDPNFATTMTNALAGKAAKATTLSGYGITDAYPKTSTYSQAEITALLAAITDRLVQATETVQGIARVASQVQVDTGSDDTAVLTSKKFRSAKATCSAWVSWNGTGTVAVRDSFNVSSITDNGVGDFTINFATPLANPNYSFCYTVGGISNALNLSSGGSVAPTVSALRVTSVSAAGMGTGANFVMTDFPYNSVQVFGGK
ncbi:hypothetical protein PF66_02288 [Pseudomonas asplenii]|uniref:Uncharacterized protein n=1 Tax=Pseudomonas asplenii TaxID=53407 RepID=A0A0N1J608_9PSED|nr:hypothetical protein [Pseudomonas fuscovaginae]KPA91405.1 hypothetical protein PF66_02288 [Pseudomonas fuscovaginae]